MKLPQRLLNKVPPEDRDEFVQQFESHAYLRGVIADYLEDRHDEMIREEDNIKVEAYPNLLSVVIAQRARRGEIRKLIELLRGGTYGRE